MNFFTKRYHPPGTPPGTLVDHEPEAKPVTIMVVDYDPSSFMERPLSDAAEARPFLDRPSITWVDVEGRPDPDEMRQLGATFGLHPLAMEDVLNTGQRPKLDAYDDQLFVVANLPLVEAGRVRVEQVSLFLGPDYVISFHGLAADPFANQRKRLQNHGGRAREEKADFLFYSLLDVIVDAGFPVLENLSERIEDIEEQLLGEPEREVLNHIHRLRQELLLLRRTLWPHREVVSELLAGSYRLIGAHTRTYLRDCHDHAVQTIDLIEAYREMTNGMLEVYLSSVSHRLNEIMRVLTVIATIFIPLTFIAGVYGMNFGRDSASPWAMPELEWYYGYPAVLLLMAAVAGGMLVYFKRKKWI